MNRSNRQRWNLPPGHHPGLLLNDYRHSAAACLRCVAAKWPRALADDATRRRLTSPACPACSLTACDVAAFAAEHDERPAHAPESFRHVPQHVADWYARRLARFAGTASPHTTDTCTGEQGFVSHLRAECVSCAQPVALLTHDWHRMTLTRHAHRRPMPGTRTLADYMPTNYDHRDSLHILALPRMRDALRDRAAFGSAFDSRLWIGAELEFASRRDTNAPQLLPVNSAWVQYVLDGSVQPQALGASEARLFGHLLTGLPRRLSKCCAAIRSAGGYPNRTTGLHVHLNVTSCSPLERTQIYRRLCRALPALAAIQPLSRGANRYCRIQSPATNAPLRDRYYAINAQAIHSHGTIEIRLAAASLQPAKILAWIHLLHYVAHRPGGVRLPVLYPEMMLHRLRDERPDLADWYARRLARFAGTSAADQVGIRNPPPARTRTATAQPTVPPPPQITITAAAAELVSADDDSNSNE